MPFMLPDLESKLQASQNARMRLIVTDGVFSMDGNVAPLKSVLRILSPPVHTAWWAHMNHFLSVGMSLSLTRRNYWTIIDILCHVGLGQPKAHSFGRWAHVNVKLHFCAI